MDNEPIVISCDMSAGADASVIVTAKALADGGIMIIDYKTINNNIMPSIKFIDRFTIYKDNFTHKSRKPLPGYRQIEMRKRKY